MRDPDSRPATRSAAPPRRPGPPGASAPTSSEQVGPARRRRRPAPSSRRSGRPTRRWCRRCRCVSKSVRRVSGRGRSRAPSSPSRSGRAPAAAPPTARPVGDRLEVVGEYPAGAAAVEGHLDGARRRPAPRVRRSSSRRATTTRSVSVPGPNERQPAADQLGVALVGLERLAARRPASPPSASSAGATAASGRCSAADRWASTPSWVSTRGAIGTSAAALLARRPDRAVPRARAPARAALARSARGRRPAPRGPPRGRRRARPRRRRPARPARRSLASRRAARVGDPGRRAPPGRRQQVAREDEQGAPHRELLDQGAVVVQRPVDVGDRQRRRRAPRSER